MIKAVLFDLDGTLLNTLQDLNTCMNMTLQQFGYPTISVEQTKEFVGNGGKKYAERALPVSERGRLDEFYAAYNKIHVSFKNENTALYPQEEECLKLLKLKGIKLAIVTNKSQAGADVLKNSILKPFDFDVVYGNREGVPVKPAPDGAFSVLKELGIEAEEAVFVGDGETDVETARNAGMRCVSVLWGYRTKEQLISAGAKIFAENYDELYKILLLM